jgi:hypothetical protein
MLLIDQSYSLVNIYAQKYSCVRKSVLTSNGALDMILEISMQYETDCPDI